jgi:glycosyltransferase involved in cell wall biosynthesis
MRIALIAPPFIPVPPKVYGGTELFIAQLAEGLQKLGHKVVVYCSGDSTVKAEKRWLYKSSQWPIKGELYANLKDMNHTAWAVADAAQDCDIIHLNNLPGLVHSRFINRKLVYTVHHPHEPGLSAFYEHYPDVFYVTISNFQHSRERMPNIHTVHHGLDLSSYKPGSKRTHLSFLGRIAPIKGTHLAVQAARKAGIPLKIAGEVQPIFRDYFESQVKPFIDGKMIEYVGEVDLKGKNELLGSSIAMLFPIQWDEPFGLVMIEAMACGAPVLALPGGAVQEVVREGVSGAVCRSVDELAQRASTAHRDFDSKAVRAYVEQNFSVARMTANYADLYERILYSAQEPLSKASKQSGLTDNRAVA